MQAIISKYISPTNYRGARVKASCERGSITLSWPDELSGEACHIWAKEKLIARFVKEDAERYGDKPGYGTHVNPWTRPTVCGQIPSGEYVHVFTGHTQANPRLIEAAPDLLGALELALATIERLAPSHRGFDSTRGTKDVVCAAIDKATVGSAEGSK